MKFKVIVLLSAIAIQGCKSTNNSHVDNINLSQEVTRHVASPSYYDELFTENSCDVTTAGEVSCSFDEKQSEVVSEKEILKLASSSNLNDKGQVAKAELILDNDRSFDAKIEAIRSAKKEIRLAYYIYTDDVTSSVFTQELIKKAQEGVKVKILLDFITNYKYLDLLTYLKNEGRGNIDIRLYNYPTDKIIKDAQFMTMPCPTPVGKVKSKECLNYKKNQMKKISGMTFYQKMFLSGLYGKSATSLKASLLTGGQIDLETYKPEEREDNSVEADNDTTAQLLDFLKLLVDARVKKDLAANIKLQLAMIFKAGDVNPLLNELSGRIAFFSGSSAQDWDHITDYLHHKVLIVDGRSVQLGGRNIEDSYHLKQRVNADSKYLFNDTDFKVEFKDSSARQIERSFDKIFSKTEMVVALARIKNTIPNEFSLNADALIDVDTFCSQELKNKKIKYQQLEKCYRDNLAKHEKYKSEADRLNEVKENSLANARKYKSNYLDRNLKKYTDSWKKGSLFSDSLSEADIARMKLYYFENTSFDLDNHKSSRKLGAKFNKEEKYNKNIHTLWNKELQSACKISREQKRTVNVIFNNAYVLMPSGLVYNIGKMMNGRFGDCSNVKITFLTNSVATTDLSIINVFARYQLIQLFRYQKALKAYENQIVSNARKTPKYKRWFPEIEYFEYQVEDPNAVKSLHTKLAIFAEDVFVGSVNMDVRSYYMDTNNGMLIRGAHDLVKDYTNYIDSIKSNAKLAQNLTTKLMNYSEKEIEQENIYMLRELLKKYDKKGRANEKRINAVVNYINQLGARISYATFKIITYKGDDFDMELLNEDHLDDAKSGIKKISNEFDDFFKIL